MCLGAAVKMKKRDLLLQWSSDDEGTFQFWFLEVSKETVHQELTDSFHIKVQSRLFKSWAIAFTNNLCWERVRTRAITLVKRVNQKFTNG